MRNILAVIIVVAIIALLVALPFALGFLAFKVCLWAGAPKYVAVIVGIAVTVFSGIGGRAVSK